MFIAYAGRLAQSGTGGLTAAELEVALVEWRPLCSISKGKDSSEGAGATHVPQEKEDAKSNGKKANRQLLIASC
jgi:hypothetical protein